ncbi:RNA-binding protein 12B-B-like isoform X2 [Sceloporus undulatus]|nr:RNA-binding protein 12B-B-like isoform X2 [Sceloporus undulatus]XP_042319456.1 RNA-binding protein 12B-B-like isoform X2 [Sceloporus undulatus]XP_042319457.1 RNA-binding protein 12B-B-like isoform X2 [Sceloporus undulatus]
MAVVIRLQGLPVVAGSSDIRRFFSGLNIPDGGVHIIGGEKGEAFIIFATDEDARQAMSYSGGYIKDSRIEFFLSSKIEMQNIIESNMKRVGHSGRERAASRWTGSSNSAVGNLSHLGAPINKRIGISTYDSLDPLQDTFHSNGSESSNTDLSKSSYQPREEKFMSENLYLYIQGMPYSATEDDIITFFAGLQVDGIIMFKTNGRNNGSGVVKFATPSDAMKGLQRDREYIGNRFIEIRRSQKETWVQNGGRVEETDHPFSNEQFVHEMDKKSYFSSKESTRRDLDYSSSRRRTHSRSSSRIMTHTGSKSPPRRTEAHTSSRSPRRVTVRTRSRSPPSRVMKHRHSKSPSQRIVAHTRSRSPPRRVMARTHSRSPPRRVTASSRSPLSGSTRSHSPHNKEYYIHVKNLPLGIGKRDLRAFFGGSDIPSSHITFLKSYDNKTNQEAVVMFRSMREYCSALGYHKHELHGRQILLFAISKTAVSQLAGFSESKSSPERDHHVKEKNDRDGYCASYTCVYARNFQYDVTKAEVQKFFAGFDICDNDIHLLYDDKGIGLGEALVKFRSDDEARKAESLNHRLFLGTEVLLRCISEKQMQEFGINISSVSEEKVQDHLHGYERDKNVYPGDSQEMSIKGNLNHASDYRHSSNDFVSSYDHLRGPAPFTEHQSEGIRGHFPDGRFIPVSNFSCGPDRITLIKLQNIPLQASAVEILDFFHGYKIIPESLSIQHNKYGMSSGEAVIALANYNEAMAAINELNDRPIGPHKVRLSLV